MPGFPEIGLKAILDKAGWTKPLNDVLRDAQKLDKTFESVSKGVSGSGKNIGKSFDDLAASFLRGHEALGVTQQQMSLALQSMGWMEKELKKIGATGIDVDKFWESIQGGKSAADALAASAQGVTEKIDILGFSISKTALAAAAGAAAFALLFKIAVQGAKDYQELGNAVRLMRLEIGGTTNEAAAWIRVTERAGVSTASFATVMGMLEKNLVDTELRLAEGLESSTQFTRAMETIGVSAYDASGNMKDAGDIMEELAVRFSEIGPGVEASGLAMALFGRSGKQILPLLFEIAEGLRKAKEDTVTLGTAMSSLDEDMTSQARIVDTDLKSAWKGFSLLIGREVTPGFTDLKRGAIQALNSIRQMVIGVLALNHAMTTVGVFSKDFNKVLYDEFGRLAGLGTEASRAAEELKIAQDKAAGAAVLQERKLGLLNDRLKESQQELDDLADTYNDRRADLVLNFGEVGEFGGRRWDDILLKRERERQDQQTATFRRDRDLWLSHQEKLDDIYRKDARRKLDIEKEQNDKIEDFNRDAQRRREELEIDHFRKLRDIQQGYLDTVGEAARRNDAVAVVRAMRERARNIRDEGTRYKDEQDDLKRNLDEKLKQIEEEAAKQRQELQDTLQEQLDDAQLAYDRQLISQQKALADQREDRALSYRREEEDFNRTKQRQFDDLEAWYKKEKDTLENHMAEMTAAAVAQIGLAAAPIAAAGVNAMATIFEAAATEIQRQQEWLMRHSYLGGQTVPAPPSSIGLSPLEQWKQRHKYLRAEGGMDIVSGPTTMGFGEAGSEAILSIPLRGQVTHSHQFSPLSVGFEGLPAGMDTGQMENMMYRVMAGLFKQVGIG